MVKELKTTFLKPLKSTFNGDGFEDDDNNVVKVTKILEGDVNVASIRRIGKGVSKI